MRSAVVLIAVLTVCLGSPPRPVPQHPNAELIERARQQMGNSRIINGNEAKITDYPWQVSLRLFGSHSCGASIISSKWLVSAAHCTEYSAGWYSVGVGDANRLFPSSTRTVKRIINHPDYGNGAGAFPNDISLIELSAPLELNGVTITAIDLVDSDTEYKDCYISGWGLKAGGASTNILQEARTGVMPQSECVTKWGKNDKGEDNVNDGHICVGGRGHEGSCNGDSGGPLMCNVDGVKRLVGATSWGYNGCRTDYPSVYSRISYFREWIKRETGI